MNCITSFTSQTTHQRTAYRRSTWLFCVRIAIAACITGTYPPLSRPLLVGQ